MCEPLSKALEVKESQFPHAQIGIPTPTGLSQRPIGNEGKHFMHSALFPFPDRSQDDYYQWEQVEMQIHSGDTLASTPAEGCAQCDQEGPNFQTRRRWSGKSFMYVCIYLFIYHFFGTQQVEERAREARATVRNLVKLGSGVAAHA